MASFEELSAQRDALNAQASTFIAQRDAALAAGDKQGAAVYQQQGAALVPQITSLTGQMADALDQLPDGSSTQGPTVTTGQSQSTPAANSRDDAYTQNPTSGGAGAGTTNNAATSVGADDNPGASKTTAQQVINQAFGTATNSQIITQPNVLDQYASYT